MSQFARLEQQICALGRMSIGLSSDPAGTTSRLISGWKIGSADPQVAQKLFMWRESGSLYVLTFSLPDTHVILAEDENRFAEWAEPLSFRQREQWHRKKLSNFPDMRNFTVPQRHCPVVGFSSIHTPLDKHTLRPVEPIVIVLFYVPFGAGSKRSFRPTSDARQYFVALGCQHPADFFEEGWGGSEGSPRHYTPNYEARDADAGGTARTSQSAFRKTASATLPRTNFATPSRPSVPKTTSPTECSCVAFKISSAGA